MLRIDIEKSYKSKEKYHIIKYEDLKNDTSNELKKVFQFLGIKKNTVEIQNIVKHCEFQEKF